MAPVTVNRDAPHDSVRRSNDEVAEEYSARIGGELAHKPLDRALLSALIEQTAPGLPTADLGCGPGHVAAWLAGRGATTVGIDLSGAMVTLACWLHPELEFRQGDLLDLPAGDGEFGAVVAFYSIIHLEAFELRPALQEMHRVLRPSGLCLVSFHVGSSVRHLSEWWGHEVDLDFCFLEPQGVVESLEAAGFVLEAKLERVSYPEEAETRRAYLLSRRA